MITEMYSIVDRPPTPPPVEVEEVCDAILLDSAGSFVISHGI